MTSTQDVSVFLHDAELNYAIAAISVGLSDAHQDMLSEMLEAHAGHKDINKEIRLLKY